MGRSAATKAEMGMREDTPRSIMRDAQDMISGAKNTMMRANVMMMGAKMMMKAPKKAVPKKTTPDDMEYSDLGGMNFDPKKMPKKRK